MKPRKKTVGEILDHSLGLFDKVSPEEIESSRVQALKYLESEAGGSVHEVMLTSTPVPPVRRSPWLAVAAVAAAIALAVLVPARVMRSAPAVLEDEAGSRKIQYGQIVRPNGVEGGTLRLPDGSRVEMRSESELSLEPAEDGVRIWLRKGDVIVNAVSRQPLRHLYVQTKDVRVSVVGTVFLVNAEEEGSRVVVIEGEVRVQQGTTEKKLGPGYQIATNPKMEALPVSEEIAWSRHAETHLALLQQSTAVPTNPRVAFEVASIRPTAVPGGGERGAGGGGVRPAAEPCGRSRYPEVDPRRFATTDSTLLALILWAYGKDCQVWHGSDLVVGGPGWIKSDGFDVEAKIPEGSPGYTAEQLRNHNAPNLQLMLQTLLADRFKLTLRREMREIPAYELTFKKSSPKLAAWKEGDLPQLTVAGGRDPEFDLQVSAVIVGGKQSMTVLARQIGEVTHRPVLDKTGLTGEFNYSFKFTPPDVFISSFPAGTRVISGPSLTTAIEELGLKLEESKGPVEVLVIDRVERPSEN